MIEGDKIERNKDLEFAALMLHYAQRGCMDNQSIEEAKQEATKKYFTNAWFHHMTTKVVDWFETKKNIGVMPKEG